MIELTQIQRRQLRAAAHHLHPVVSIAGNGLSEAVVKEISRALAAHELIKVKLYGIEREQRDAMLGEICAALGLRDVPNGAAPRYQAAIRRVMDTAGLLILTGVVLGYSVSPLWFGLSGFIGAGLTFAGLSGTCGMARVLMLMPWNKAVA